MMVPKKDLTFWLALTTTVVTVGSSVECGYHFGVITAPSTFIKDFYNETYFKRHGTSLSKYGIVWLWATTVSIFCIGTAVGTVVGKQWADKFGRTRSLIYNTFISIAASILMGCSQVATSPEMLIFGRSVIGFSVGVSLTIVPVYLVEISPYKLRGAITNVHRVLFTVGILIGQVMGFFVLYRSLLWPGVLSLPATVDIIQIIFLVFCPESPRWLLTNKYDSERAAGALRQLRGVEDVDAEIHDIRDDYRNVSRITKVSVCEVLFLRSSNWKMPLLTCVIIQAGQQLSGINSIIFYSTEIYTFAGMTTLHTALASAGFGAIYAAVTLIMVLIDITKLRRRPLLIYTFGILTLCITGLTASLAFKDQFEWMAWPSAGCIYIYIIAFAIAPAILPSIVCAELWAQAPRQAAVCISHQINLWTNFVVQFVFPIILETIGEYTFVIFAVCLLVTTVFICLYLPETKDRRFVEIISGFQTMSSINDEDSQQDGCTQLPLTNR